MDNLFYRNKLLFGENYLEILQDKRVIVFGVGGVGGHAAEALVRSGIIHLTIVDNDEVKESNINRQLVASTSRIGQKKVEVLKERLLDINPKADIVALDIFYLPDSDLDLSKYDYIVDAIDTVTSKLALIEKAHKLGVSIISALGCGNRIDPTKLEVTDISKTAYDPLAKVVRQELRKRGINHSKVVYSKEEAIKPAKDIEENGRHIPGSSPFVPPVAGIILASEVVKDLLK